MANFEAQQLGQQFQREEILQSSTPYDVENLRSLPGIAPLNAEDWLLTDDVYAAQMAERTRLLRTQREDVLALRPEGREAAEELLQHVLDWLIINGQGFAVSGGQVLRPDGVVVNVDRADPLGSLGHIVQDDFCLLQKQGEEHFLVGAVLCFPASWRLADKIGRPLIGIHARVPEYDDQIARRVQRLFDGVQVGRPLWRFNRLHYADPTLFQPVSRQTPSEELRAGYPYLRTERQCVLRLPKTQACVFSIHTYVLKHAVNVPVHK
ncbi:hypothetical protein ROA7450_02218 [Roseovarius albus]|uniref:DUF3445 domain-containing protein n=1 Tax=Roseovarius albus TaxID=1247867 RepID=A0A1X6ZAR2_9RHOB|nr:DUF3445 domain-containing protein [Roseovarius albus]SLN45714.1 hypothetical protein ROA7450_02218 [Roseovarius albus]